MLNDAAGDELCAGEVAGMFQLDAVGKRRGPGDRRTGSVVTLPR